MDFSFLSTTPENDRFIRALLRQPVDRPPAWIMRQAGRYLPEYKKTRQQAGSFMELCKNPELATEVVLQPLRRFPELDAAILFSDILTIPAAMGLDLSFVENEGPKFANPINHRQDVERLCVPSITKDLSYVIEAVRLIRETLDNRLPLIGFAGSPWTLATYMVEGRGKSDFSKVKTMLYNEPAVMHQLLEKLTEATIEYLTAQIDNGAQVVQLFDTWGGILSTEAYHDFSLKYMAQIIQSLPKEKYGRPIPTILFTKGGDAWLPAIADTGTDAVAVDWTIQLSEAKKLTQGKVAVQGNLDPAILLASKEVIARETQKCLVDYASDGDHTGHIFNLGHGITPNVNPNHLHQALKTVASFATHSTSSEMA